MLFKMATKHSVKVLWGVPKLKGLWRLTEKICVLHKLCLVISYHAAGCQFNANQKYVY